jgi:hypothetical protein
MYEKIFPNDSDKLALVSNYYKREDLDLNIDKLKK